MVERGGMGSGMRGCCGWKRGLLCGESGVFEVGLFRFRLKKRRDVSRRSHVKENISRFQARLTFLYFVFWCFCGAKIVFFLFIRVFSWRKSGVFFVHCGECVVGNEGFYGSNAGFAVFEKAVKFYCKGRYVGGGGCYYGSVQAVSGYESEACEEGDG